MLISVISSGQLLCCVWPFVTPWTAARQASLLLLLLSPFSHVWLCATPSLGFSRQEHWSGLPFPSPMRESEKWKWSRSVQSNEWSRSELRDPMDCSLPGSSIHPSPTPGAYSNSCPSSRWCHSTISSSVIPFSSCLQSFPASGSFPMNQFFSSGGQSIGASASASVLPMNIQDWCPLGLTRFPLGLYDFCHTTTQIAHQHIYIYPSLLSLPTSPPPSQPFRSAQRTGLGSLLYTAASH